MTKSEIELVNRMVDKDGWEVSEIVRRSDKEFDLTVKGRYKESHPMGGVCFSAWLVLATIRELTDWTNREVAQLTDHPNMAMEGDWSGVRDTNSEALWEIFNKFVAK